MARRRKSKRLAAAVNIQSGTVEVVGVLPNAKHERFAQELAKGKAVKEAYQIAGYKNRSSASSRAASSRLLKKNDLIAQRVNELKNAIADKSCRQRSACFAGIE